MSAVTAAPAPPKGDLKKAGSMLAAGLASGSLMYFVALDNGGAFLPTALLGIAGYGLAEITRRLYWQFITPDSAPSTNRIGIFRIQSMSRLVGWGLLNGVLFFLLFPYIQWSAALSILTGAILVNARELIIHAIRKYFAYLPSAIADSLASFTTARADRQKDRVIPSPVGMVSSAVGAVTASATIIGGGGGGDKRRDVTNAADDLI